MSGPWTPVSRVHACSPTSTRTGMQSTARPASNGQWRIAASTSSFRPFALTKLEDIQDRADDHAARIVQLVRKRAHVTAVAVVTTADDRRIARSEEHTYELQSLMRNSYAVFRS